MLGSALKPQGSDDGIRYAVFGRMHRVSVRFKRFSQRWTCMGWITVVDDHVFRVACLCKFNDFIVSSVRGERKLVNLKIDVCHRAVNVQPACVQQRAPPAASRLVTRQQHSIAGVVTKAIEEPEGWSTVEHARSGHDHICLKRTLSIGFG